MIGEHLRDELDVLLRIKVYRLWEEADGHLWELLDHLKAWSQLPHVQISKVASSVEHDDEIRVLVNDLPQLFVAVQSPAGLVDRLLSQGGHENLLSRPDGRVALVLVIRMSEYSNVLVASQALFEDPEQLSLLVADGFLATLVRP